MVDALGPRNIAPLQTVKPVVGSKDKPNKSKKKEEVLSDEAADEGADGTNPRKGRQIDDHA